ncbi:MAG: hypothetical protein IKU45_05755 [Clostridia bacterium]|nr:hypothetical protein [Clostridia bacterium]
MELRPADKLCLARFAGVSPAEKISRKVREVRKEMEGGNGMSEANEVTLPQQPCQRFNISSRGFQPTD